MKIVDDVVAIICTLRDHSTVSDKLIRSEQLRLKEEVFVDRRSGKMEEFTCVVRFDSHGEDKKYSVEATEFNSFP